MLTVPFVGCGAGRESDGAGDRVDYQRMLVVAADEDATATEIVEAGAPVEAARSGVTRLVAYNVHNDDDEGRSAAAWRLYDDHGRTLADGAAGVTTEGHAHPQVISLSQGYLLVDEDGTARRVANDGTVTRALASRTPVRPRPGDVPIGGWSTRIYRPAGNVVFRPVPNWPHGQHSWALTADGMMWSQGAPRTRREESTARFARSRDGGQFVDVAPYVAGAGRMVVSGVLVIVGTRVVAPVVSYRDGSEHFDLAGVILRDTAAPPSQAWTYHRTPRVPGHLWNEVHMVPVDDHTVLLATADSSPRLLDLDTGATRRIPEPTTEEGWSVRLESGELLATHPNHAAARASSDLGVTWKLLPH